jgi:hypothetical protein
MSHCGLDDKDGSLILDSLVPDGTSSISSSLCGSSSGGCARHHTWYFLDLSHNMLEGGAALCAATLVSVIGSSSTDGTGLQHQQQQRCFADTFFCSTGSSGARPNSSRANREPFGSFGRSFACNSLTGTQKLGQRVLLLDGNPLGASGVRSIMRALAGSPSVGVLPPAYSACSSSSSSSSAAQGKGLSLSACPLNSSCSDYLPAGVFELGCRAGLADGDKQQQQQPLSLHVGIAKVALMEKEKGFRSSMRDTQSAMMLALRVRQDNSAQDAYVHAIAGTSVSG